MVKEIKRGLTYHVDGLKKKFIEDHIEAFDYDGKSF